MAGQIVTPVVALRNFFGMKEGQTTTEFLTEVKGLTPAEREELGKLAAAAMGDTIKLVEPVKS